MLIYNPPHGKSIRVPKTFVLFELFVFKKNRVQKKQSAQVPHTNAEPRRTTFILSVMPWDYRTICRHQAIPDPRGTGADQAVIAIRSLRINCTKQQGNYLPNGKKRVAPSHRATLFLAGYSYLQTHSHTECGEQQAAMRILPLNAFRLEHPFAHWRRVQTWRHAYQWQCPRRRKTCEKPIEQVWVDCFLQYKEEQENTREYHIIHNDPSLKQLRRTDIKRICLFTDAINSGYYNCTYPWES